MTTGGSRSVGRRKVTGSVGNEKYATVIGAAVLLAALNVAPAAAPDSTAHGWQFNSTTLLYEIPTADVLPAGTAEFWLNGTYPLTNTPENVDYPEANASIRFSPYKHFDFGVTAYTFSDYVLDVKYQILGGKPDRFGLAVGVYDIGFHRFISPIGIDSLGAWPDWRYNRYLPRYDRQPEWFSAFLVTSIPVTRQARFTVGLGHGRFVGYDKRSKYLNTDIFFSEYHPWALAAIAGVEVYITPHVALVAEASSRDLNSGVKACFGPFAATVAWTKMEGLLFAQQDLQFGRLYAGVTYRFNDWGSVAGLFRRRETYCPPRIEPVPPPPAPAEVPGNPAPVTEAPRLEPIWFDWDKWDIRPEAAATLRRDAEVLLAHPEMKVVVVGIASEEGTVAHNVPLSGRRAQAAMEYLKSLGVPAAQMRVVAEGESPGRPLPLHRSVYFEPETDKQ
jgi:hypothetical protein